MMVVPESVLALYRAKREQVEQEAAAAGCQWVLDGRATGYGSDEDLFDLFMGYEESDENDAVRGIVEAVCDSPSDRYVESFVKGAVETLLLIGQELDQQEATNAT